MTDSFSKIVFRLKKPELISNSALLSKLWFYYEYPAILFLQEIIGGSFIGASNGRVFVSEYAQYMSDFTVEYRSSQQNVLWINSNTTIVLNKL